MTSHHPIVALTGVGAAVALCLVLALWSGNTGPAVTARAGGALSPMGAVPARSVTLQPDNAYPDSVLRGSSTYADTEGHPEGVSRYRWLVNGSQVAAGDVPQSLLLSLDNSLLSSDGQAPALSQGLTFTTGRFGQAVQLSRLDESRLAYPSAGNVDPNEGSLELWIKLSQDLDSGTYQGYPRLFSYSIDDEHELYVEVNAGRIILTSRNAGSYYGTWPEPPGWLAGEWHHLAASWSAAANQLAVYYDCAPVATADYPALAGSVGSFNLGSTADGGVTDAVLDDVRLSRRALTADEIALTCSRGSAAPNDEVVLLPGQAAVGDVVTLEMTECDQASACAEPASTQVQIKAYPLGALSPASDMLPYGTNSVTLSLTTAAPADCRWNDQPSTPYAAMPNAFQTGQGTTSHSTPVTGLGDMRDHAYYVRCADASTGAGSDGERSPDDFEQATQLRSLGPWDGGYPRIANLWGSFDPQLGSGFFARYDLFVPTGWSGGSSQAAAIRQANPRAKILLNQSVTYADTVYDPLANVWAGAQPTDPGYNCLLRDAGRNILDGNRWNLATFNLTVPDCRAALANRSVDGFLSARSPADGGLTYDGLYWDGMEGTVSGLSDSIDSNLDGQPDDPASLDAAFRAGLQDLAAQVRARLAGVIIVGNGAPPAFNSWLNGRLYEWELSALLDGRDDWSGWSGVVDGYRSWSAAPERAPGITFIQSAPELLFSQKFDWWEVSSMVPAMQAEAAASYQRMRYGLTSALMGDGAFSYDYGPDWHGATWWYDEYGAAPDSQPGSLPPQGYLGQPIGEPWLVDSLTTWNQIANGDFTYMLDGWYWYIDGGAGAAATVGFDLTGGISQTVAAHIVVTKAAGRSSVEFRQPNLSILADQDYTVSFWARSSAPRPIYVDVSQAVPPWAGYGFNVQAELTTEWRHYDLVDRVNTTAGDGKLQFWMGDATGEVWLDNIQFRQGVSGVWAREFRRGLALINTTRLAQDVALPGCYRKINGSQAPLFQVRVDDDAGQEAGSWMEQTASHSQFGATAHRAPGNSNATMVYTTELAYAGSYEVLAWVVPDPAQSAAASVTIHHVHGDSTVNLDETSGPLGWHSLGTYTFEKGAGASARLSATGSGTVVADAIKWVSLARYNDGSLVNQVNLQPLDGIVLTTSSTPDCTSPRHYLYVPALLHGP